MRLYERRPIREKKRIRMLKSTDNSKPRYIDVSNSFLVEGLYLLFGIVSNN